jgi:hypothetical protein
VYWEVCDRLVGNVPWVNLSPNNQTYLSQMLDSCADKDKRSFKESEFLCPKGKVLPNVNVHENIVHMKIFWDVEPVDW